MTGLLSGMSDDPVNFVMTTRDKKKILKKTLDKIGLFV